MSDDKREAYRDGIRHSLMDRDLADAYFKALKQLKNEGNERARVVFDMLTLRINDRGYKEASPSVFDWAYNIHNNTWGDTSFAGILKARVVRNRIKGD